MLRSFFLHGGLLSVLFLSGCAKVAPPQAQHKVVQEEPSRTSNTSNVRLIVWITVDQMRGDYLEKYRKQLSGGGFSWLIEHGRRYRDVHYGHAITETAPGHATLFTGAAPREHGIIANQWMLEDGTEITSVTDSETRLVVPGEKGIGTGEGRSPRQLLVPTVGDALVQQLGSEARVVSISAKDRGAILPAGKRGQAYWLGPAGFVTSTYYRGKAPDWLVLHQASNPLSSYFESGWPLAASAQVYQNAPSELSYAPKEWTPGFPHRLVEGANFVSAAASSPFGDEAVMDVALAALEGEELGRDAVPDLLAISLSSTDGIGHQFGPESRELEDQLYRLDGQIMRLVEAVHEFLDLGEMVIALSADHGVCESAEFLRGAGRSGRRLTESALEEGARARLTQEFGHDRYLLGVTSPYVSLNRDAIIKDGFQLQRVRKLVAQALKEVEGVELAHIVKSSVPEGALGRRLASAIHPERSGDIYIVPKRDTLLLQSESLGATHGSPWGYDTHVPLLLVGRGVEPGTSTGGFDVRSLAPTISHLAGIKPPAAANAPLLPIASER